MSDNKVRGSKKKLSFETAEGINELCYEAKRNHKKRTKFNIYHYYKGHTTIDIDELEVLVEQCKERNVSIAVYPYAGSHLGEYSIVLYWDNDNFKDFE